MSARKSILIVFPDEWLQYSPSVLNLYECCSEKYDTKLIYIDNGKFNNAGLASNATSISIGKFAAYFWRKTLGYKFYKIQRLALSLLFTKLFDKRYDFVIAIDSSGYAVTKPFFKNVIYFSLETEKDIYYRISEKMGIKHIIIQSEDRKNYLVGTLSGISVHYIQNSPILRSVPKVSRENKSKRILYMGNIEFGYGLEQFIDCVKELDGYTLTLKGIKNENFYNKLKQDYAVMIDSGKLIFDFDYTPQEQVIEYTSRFYIGITGYDIELAKKSFNYFSSPAGKLFNYYAAGVPVIGIDIIGLKSVKDYNAGVLINEVSSEKIKNAIECIEKDYTLISHNCIKAAKDFDFKKGFDVFINTINEAGRKI